MTPWASRLCCSAVARVAIPPTFGGKGDTSPIVILNLWNIQLIEFTNYLRKILS